MGYYGLFRIIMDYLWIIYGLLWIIYGLFMGYYGLIMDYLWVIMDYLWTIMDYMVIPSGKQTCKITIRSNDGLPSGKLTQ